MAERFLLPVQLRLCSLVCFSQFRVFLFSTLFKVTPEVEISGWGHPSRRSHASCPGFGISAFGHLLVTSTSPSPVPMASPSGVLPYSSLSASPGALWELTCTAGDSGAQILPPRSQVSVCWCGAPHLGTLPPTRAFPRNRPESPRLSHAPVLWDTRSGQELWDLSLFPLSEMSLLPPDSVRTTGASSQTHQKCLIRARLGPVS